MVGAETEGNVVCGVEAVGFVERYWQALYTSLGDTYMKRVRQVSVSS